MHAQPIRSGPFHQPDDESCRQAAAICYRDSLDKNGTCGVGFALDVAKQSRCPKYETIALKLQSKTAALRCVRVQRRGIMAKIGAVGVAGLCCSAAVAQDFRT
ncbi:hypothetical protein JQ604_33165 [Bradyrhizobium jicamae]|uniref:hypothetical protein n=1 Tax=Bradyrhizobium jicamae TaxID=280332 RepID=UPI001BABE19E|nr:hypothetical protein [Bradyrhizobium jicamae]MBR0757059.1 hypothetical protein [Bradyrhizobium jicamae]